MRLLRQVRAFFDERDTEWDILFDERLRRIAPEIDARSGYEIIDGSGKLLLTQVVDPHVHFNDPGYTQREDFAHGSRAAARGGITTVFDMPCTSLPPVTNREALHGKLSQIEAKALVNFGLWGGVHAGMCADPTVLETSVSELAEAGVVGIKTYLTSGMDTFPALSPSQLQLVMLAARRHGLRVGVHAEEPTLIERLTATARSNGRNRPGDYAASRPVLAEALAIAQVVELARDTGAAVHIVHLSSARGLELIGEARAAGVDITTETCPHYLAFTDEDLERLGSVLKTAPVVKSATDRNALWSGLTSGDIDMVGTDHAPCDFASEKESGDIWQDYSGLPGEETLLGYLVEEGLLRRGLSLEWLQRITSHAAQDAFGLNLGRLRTGDPATFTLIDLDSPWQVDPAQFASRGKFSPFAGRTFTAGVDSTWLDGEPVFAAGTVNESPRGRFLTRGTQ